jgi:hypothetical protein
VVASKFACTNHGDTNPLRFSRHRAHSFFIPFEASLGSGKARGGNA